MLSSKVCNRCGILKSADDFGRKKYRNGTVGLVSYCKECERERAREYREKNRSKVLASSRKHYENNKDKYKERWKEYYEENREIIKERQKQYRKEHPEKVREYSKRARERHKENRKIIIEAYGGKCECCGESHWELLTIDHINGGGRAHRRTLTNSDVLSNASKKFYKWLIENDFPKNDFRLLCFNCNIALGTIGYCPHENLRPNKQKQTAHI